MTSIDENPTAPRPRPWMACVTHRVLGAFACCTALVAAAPGCNGGAAYTIASLNMKRISAGESLTERIEARECYHWVNDNGELCVAIRMNHPSLLGKRFSKTSLASFVLGDPPAATGRDYAASQRTARFLNHAGYRHTRAASIAGTVGVWNYDQRAISGRFRLTTIQQSYSVLTGWTGNKRALYVGEFRSVPDRNAGEAILRETERDGMERKRPATRPRRIQGPFPTRPNEKK